MKKAFLGMFASLMLAGVLSAASSLTTTPPDGMAVMIGEGTSPMPLLATAAEQHRDVTSPNK